MQKSAFSLNPSPTFGYDPKLAFVSKLKTKKAKDAKQLSFLYSLKRLPLKGSRATASNPESSTRQKQAFVSKLKTKKSQRCEAA